MGLLVHRQNDHHLNLYIILISLSTLIPVSSSMSYKLTMDTSGSDTMISSYNTDIGSCSCDIHSSSCDVFCCCDTSCSSSQTQAWSTNQLCSNTRNTIERSCDNLSSGGYWSFDDLACVYYSNRGNISYFYSYPDSGSINYPTPQKFVSRTISMQAINVASSTATSNPYSVNELLVKVNKGDLTQRLMEIWSPVAGGDCGIGYVNISSSQSFSCLYSLTSKTCPLSTSLFYPSTIVCKSGDCSENTTFPSFTPSTVSTSTSLCTNFITTQTIDITISSSGNKYKIDSIMIKLQQKDVDMSLYSRYQVKTTINVLQGTGAVSYFGNPGYSMNKKIIVEKSNVLYNFLNIADSAGNCLLNSSTNTSSTANILFGQNYVQSCISSNPCTSSLYIDQIAKQSLTIRKWAKSSDNSSIQVSGTGSNVNTCTSQQIILNILYSTGGWIADPQNYIVGAEITTKASIDSTWNKKYFKVNWIYVDPNTITNPRQNQFYSYFSYIWTPLREYFGVY